MIFTNLGASIYAFQLAAADQGLEVSRSSLQPYNLRCGAEPR